MTKLLSRSLVERFGADRRGNVAMIAALAVVPLSIASLGAVDLTRNVAARVELQDALDAAALAAGRSGSSDASTLQALGQRILSQNLAGAKDFTVATSSFAIGADGQLVASATANYQPTFSLMSGGGPKQISASTEVTRANSILEIAMVLDNTGSMNDSLGSGASKISLLRTAAANFVTTMGTASKQSSEANSISISLVPFSNTVNVGSSYKTATWIDQAGVSPINDEIFTTAQGVTQHANRFDLFKALNTSWGGCVESRKAPYDIQDTPPTTSTPATLFTPYFAPDEQDPQKSSTQVNSYANDYVNDPSSGDQWAKQGSISKYTTGNIKTTSGGHQSQKAITLDSTIGPNAGCGLQAVHPLTTDFAGLTASINQMVAVGDTNIPMGLVWGWHTLSPDSPFDQKGVNYLTAKHKKIVVLMTDGQDTMTNNSNIFDKSYYSGVGYVWQGRVLQADGTALKSLTSSASTRTAAMDDRLSKLCTNMKASAVDIEIYVVGVGVTSASRTLLQSCATDKAHYFDVTVGTALDGTFQGIANQISQLHLSK